MTQLWVQLMLGNPANNPTNKNCISSRKNVVAIPSALVPDVAFACTGGTVSTTNKEYICNSLNDD